MQNDDSNAPHEVLMNEYLIKVKIIYIKIIIISFSLISFINYIYNLIIIRRDVETLPDEVEYF